MSPKAKPPVFLVDGTSLVYRAHYAFIANPLHTAGGRDVSALYGFANTILNLLRGMGAEAMTVAFDTAAPTFRHEQYPEYKATRPEIPPEIVDQIPEVKRFLDAMGIVRLEQEGVEADDILGSLAQKLSAAGRDVVLVSSDKDLMQLIGPRIRQLIPARGREPARWIDDAAAEKKWGVPPERLRDFFALVGDASDNIPGVPGVGPKTASKLLQEHGSLEEIYDHLQEIPGAARKKLEQNREQAFLSRELVTLRVDLEPPAPPEAFAVGAWRDSESLRRFLREFEFRRLESQLNPPAEADPGGGEPVVTADELETLAAEINRSQGPLSVLGLGQGRRPLRGRLKALALCWADGAGALLRLDGDGALPARAVARRLGPILADPRRLKVTHRVKTLLHLLHNHDMTLAPPWFDLEIASYLLDPARRHDLPALTQEFLKRALPVPQAAGAADLFAGVELSEDDVGAAREGARA
ncbi:MAG: hypothetical protein GF355_02475, partial [Candidatus Eisenbacteria bacterium]|nr:hypothetical protein [Candidatus Eisenbacteria bacterium]